MQDPKKWLEMVLKSQNMGKTYGNSMNNLFSYFGLVNAKINASEKDLSVLGYRNMQKKLEKTL